ncbi:MAG: hypothetical protein PHE11_05145 [Candidatus Omnitrophica bacterium]|nr:hypothetical protein [Syntrophaceae bacterium]MDD2297081.1 hypothetical protein [Sphaerochaetaceae bacterium]MDD5526771.1 hypothetical protein [Candidatus Omnitrophota bacterium]
MSAKSQYQDKIAKPVLPGGGCHSWIMSGCNLGVMAGISPQEIFTDIRRVLHPSRGDTEITDAIEKALLSHGDGNHRRFKSSARQSTRKTIIRNGAAVFNQIIAQGKYSEEAELTANSPIAIPENPKDQQRLFFETTFAQDEFVFCGDRLQPGTDKTILPSCEWAMVGSSGPFVIVNGFTGRPAPTKSGDKQTFRGDHCIKSFKHCLVEFDNKSIEDQVRFWSAIRLPIKAVIHTGNKSLHAWVDVSSQNITNVEQWEKTIKIDLYEARLKPLGVDMACSNPSRLSRLPGVFRADKNQWQRLLWLSKEGCYVC